MAGLPSYPIFDCSGEGKAVRWDKWVKRLELLFVAYNITDDKRKQALLLTYGGEDLSDIFDNFPTNDVTPRPGNDQDTHYQRTVDAFTHHFNPQTNTEYQRYVFRRTQQESKSIDQFYTVLRQIAQTCGFTDVDREIKSQIISGCTSDAVRKKGLCEPEITLIQLLKHGRMLELTDAQSKAIEGQTVNTVKPVKKLHKSYTKNKSQSPHKHPQSKSNQNCHNCGTSWPHKGGQRQCPAFGKTCTKCNKRNHFARVCKSSHVNIRALDEKETEDDQGNDYIFMTSGTLNKLPSFTVKVNDHELSMLADSGSTVNIIAETEYNKMANKPPLVKSSSKVFAYGAKQSLQILGYYHAKVTSGDKCCHAKFLVTSGDHGSLLSWNTSRELNLLQPGNVINTVTNTNNSILDSYPELFRGVGKLKDYKVKLHIDSSVKPVAQKFRRAPFHLRKDIEAQIKDDEDAGIIEKSEGPTPWVSPVVCVPKPKTGKTRVCVDMRQANKAIKRERHSTPTLSELVSDLSEARVFSKLDLNQGYNQLELHEDSRCITTFATHVGLRRYNRLFFGINSAAEIFQEAIRNTLSDLKGVMNISDDILVYGENEEKHNDNLKAVLERLREKGLTLNRAKCELNKATVEYFGHVFSATGLSPNPKKIDAILQMQSPTTQSELRSFLGLTNYCGSRFVPNYATLTHELRQLTQKHIPWKWEQKHEEAIMKLKEALSKSVILNYYSMQRKTEVYVDASPVGLSAILMQYDDANDERDIIQFASRALTPTEAKYSQTEREALSVVFACEHFNMYVYGTSFTVITDHKPLTSIFGASATMKTLNSPHREMGNEVTAI